MPNVSDFVPAGNVSDGAYASKCNEIFELVQSTGEWISVVTSFCRRESHRLPFHSFVQPSCNLCGEKTTESPEQHKHLAGLSSRN